MKYLKMFLILVLGFIFLLTGSYAINYAAGQVNYKTISNPPLTYGAASVLTNGANDFYLSDADGWDSSTANPIGQLIIDLGSIKDDVKSVVLWTIPRAGYGISNMSTGSVYVGIDNSGTTWNSVGRMLPLGNNSDDAGFFVEGKKWFWQTQPGSQQTCRFVRLDVSRKETGQFLLFAEVAVYNEERIINYALNTTPPSNYGTLTYPPLNYWAGEAVASNKVFLTNGRKSYFYSNGPDSSDGWGNSTVEHNFVIDLGSVQSNIKMVAAWNVANAGDFATGLSAMTIYRSSTDTTSWSLVGSAVPYGITTENQPYFVEPEPWFFGASTTDLISARYIRFQLFPNNPNNVNFLFSEFGVFGSTLTDIDNWYLYGRKQDW